MWWRLRRLVRRSRRKLPRVSKVIVDTSFLLPYLGLRVEEVSDEVMDWLESVELYYPYVMVPEVIGVVIKKARSMGLSAVPGLALQGLNTVVYGGFVNMVPLVNQDLSIAYDLVKRGLRDLFDALLYATSKRTGITAITVDEALLKFLRSGGFEASNMILLT